MEREGRRSMVLMMKMNIDDIDKCGDNGRNSVNIMISSLLFFLPFQKLLLRSPWLPMTPPSWKERQLT